MEDSNLRLRASLSLPKLASLPQWLLQLSNLEDLTICECEELDLCKDESGNLILDSHGGLHHRSHLSGSHSPSKTSISPTVASTGQQISRISEF
ncbi:hypothetical protein NL676_029816 [Syzygium grande]|nr:hypothetical protein NL676_029816 [Syzygium grande]